ncbi:unnamed protein product [Rotaria sordida]|uniref:F-box domain-containing protein n=2 Tax=Rotaria sordida TaxID=392033 RepID=A0A813SFU1_9BILA|nr:unnamed protein product [Rotaria sordida]
MEHLLVELNTLPDEILMIILKKLLKVEVLYSLIGVNKRLNKIVRDSIFTNRLTLMIYSSDDFIYPLSDPMLDRFCLKILPEIHHQIKWLNLESSSMKRIVRATNYPNLYGFGLFNLNVETTLSLFTELHVTLKTFNDCLYLLDGRFNRLHTLHVDVSTIHCSDLTISNKEKLPNLKCFSLHCNMNTHDYDEFIVPLLQRMSNLEKLDLYLIVCDKQTFVDGNELKKNIINHMSQLNKFSFNIRTIIHLHNQINLPSNQDIQHTFKDFQYNQIVSCVDYFPMAEKGQCLIYSYPYRLKHYDKITNNFSNGFFEHVNEITLFDEHPFEHEFFLRIAQSFPFIKSLTLFNNKPQTKKLYSRSKKNSQDLPIIKYPHLVKLNLIEAHNDYIEQFLIDWKISLTNIIRFSVCYRPLREVTRNFTRNTTRINCTKLIPSCLHGDNCLPQHVKDYFPCL